MAKHHYYFFLEFWCATIAALLRWISSGFRAAAGGSPERGAVMRRRYKFRLLLKCEIQLKGVIQHFYELRIPTGTEGDTEFVCGSGGTTGEHKITLKCFILLSTTIIPLNPNCLLNNSRVQATSEGRFRGKICFLFFWNLLLFNIYQPRQSAGNENISLFNFYRPAVMLILDTLNSSCV